MKKTILAFLPLFLFFGIEETAAQPTGCSASASINVSVGQKPVASFSLTAFGLTLVFQNGSTGGASFLWDFGDGQTSTVANPAHTFPADGLYDITLTAVNNCGSATFHQQVLVKLVAAPEAGGSVKIEVSPNPGDGLFLLKIMGEPAGFGQIRVFDAAGRLINTLLFDGLQPSCPLDLGGQPAGVYQLRISVDGAVVVRQLLKQ